jgi:hypothetical protein
MIDNKQRIAQLKAKDYQKLFGVRKETFEQMMEILQTAYVHLHARGGKNPKLSVLDKLIITLGYYREYRTQEHIAFDYGVVKSAICESIQWVETELIKAECFHLPGKKVLRKMETAFEVLLLDATEHEIERPQKNKSNGTLGKRRSTP